ncbi:unnamed protein product [Trifolium pratense]|uniref:Uncharacterized protein n=1 Tax=Trifolium pratense TaxID=57577 RepID=A0ACB0M6C5_TRIPR|nr:unnamed protein product [Trifolium pratense]
MRNIIHNHEPFEFYDQWERELHRLDYGRIIWNKQSVRVYFEFNDTQKVMYGNDVSYLFVFERPTKVRLEYQIKNNLFSLSLIESSDDQDNASTVVLHGVQEDEPAQELQYVADDEIAENPQQFDQQPILAENSANSDENINDPAFHENEENNDESLYKWELTVSKAYAYANRTKSQVLHFSPKTAQFVLRDKKYLIIDTPHQLIDIRCTMQERTKTREGKILLRSI